jgi:CubicO group peptidase (beta-lactamase class C family)
MVSVRSSCILTALTLAVAAPSALPAQDAPALPALAAPGRPQPIAFNFSPGWADLAELAELVRAQSGVPGVALAVVRDGRIVDAAVAGTTSLENGRPLTLSDSFEWGSLTKSVTGTVIARLIADHALTADSTIARIFPELPMRDGYRDITLAQLMRHEAGLPPYTQLTPAIAARLRSYDGTDAEKRLAFVGELLQEDPLAARGERFIYSNADIAVAAAMAERVTGKDWQHLVREYVFAPAGTSTAGFGAPASAEHPDANRGHLARPGQPLVPAPFGMYADISAVIGPAGFVSSPIGDMARYAMFHLAGERQGAGGIPVEIFAIIHAPDPASRAAPGGGRYNYGWGIVESGVLEGHRSYWHNGSDGTFYAELHVVPDADLAVMIMANAGGPIAVSSRPVLVEMARRYGT